MTQKSRKRSSAAKKPHKNVNRQGSLWSWGLAGALALGGIGLMDQKKLPAPESASLKVPEILSDAKTLSDAKAKPNTEPAPVSQETTFSLPQSHVPVPVAASRTPDKKSDTMMTSNSGFAKIAFGYCGQGAHVNCIGDGGALWHQGTQIRIAGITIPDPKTARCSHERRVAFTVKARLLALLNDHAFTLHHFAKSGDGSASADIFLKDKGSLGPILTKEGLAHASALPTTPLCKI